jgi:hypothetical protein
MPKLVNYQDNFESLYLRCDYLKKLNSYDVESIKKYKPIVNTTAYIMYDKLKFIFDKVGFDVDDIVQITNSYLLAYMGLYSFKHNKELFNRYVLKYKEKWGQDTEPPQSEIDRVERNNLIYFLRQRLQHCSTICERKGRNIKIEKTLHRAFAETDLSKPADEETIMGHYKEFGYRKVTCKEFNEAKKRAKLNHSKLLMDEQGYRIIDIQIFDKALPQEEYQLMIENFMSFHRSAPDQLMMEVEEAKQLESYKTRFEGCSQEHKIKALKNFINQFKGNRKYKDELKQAKQMLIVLKNVV